MRQTSTSSSCFGGIYYLVYYWRGESQLSVNINDVDLHSDVFPKVLLIGVPAALGSILMSCSQIIMNMFMASYGDMQVAAIGVAMKIVMITGMVSMGIGQGVQPLLGYCVGSLNLKKFKQYMGFSIIFATALGVLLTAFCYIFVNQITNAFLANANAFDYAVKFAKILCCSSPLFGIYYTLINALQTMGASVASLISNVSRQGLIYIPCLFIFNVIFGLYGLVWAQPIAD